MRGRVLQGLAIGTLLTLTGCGGDESPPYADTGGGPPLRSGTTGSSAGADDGEPGSGADEEPGDEPSAGGASEDPPDAGEEPDPKAVPPSAALSVVELDDERGDADSWPGMLRYPIDLVSVELETISDELRVRFELSRTLAEHFAFPGVGGQRTGGVPCELYLDLDDDPTTGVEPFWASESAWADELVGYEAEIDVLLGFDFVTKDDGSEGYGAGDFIVDDAEHEITGYFAEYWLMDKTDDMHLGPGAGDGGFDTGLADTRPLTTIEGRVIELRVPLAWLDLESGDVVRLMYRENDQGPVSGLGYSRNARLRVR